MVSLKDFGDLYILLHTHNVVDCYDPERFKSLGQFAF